MEQTIYIRINEKNEIVETCSAPIPNGIEYKGTIDFQKLLYAKLENGQIVYDEIAYQRDREQMALVQKQADYEALVENKIRQRYTLSQELAILRQRDTKKDEYQEYFNYCEACKARAKKSLAI